MASGAAYGPLRPRPGQPAVYGEQARLPERKHNEPTSRHEAGQTGRKKCKMKFRTPFAACLCLTTVGCALLAASAQANPPTKGQGQLAGGPAQFGVTYTLKGKINFAVLAARYTLEPYSASEPLTAGTDEKLIVLDIAIKNANPNDASWNRDGFFTLVDSTGQQYVGGNPALESLGGKYPSFTLRPGQGLGQPGLKDPLHMAWHVPATARIVKIMVNTGRLYVKPAEQVFRYYIAGATKAEAGADGNPKNIIAPLPANVADPTDKSGAVALPEGIAASGEWVPSGAFHLRLDSTSSSTDAVTGDAPNDGTRYEVVSITAKLVLKDRGDLTMGDVMGGDNTAYQLTDADGERYKPVKFLKAGSTDYPNQKFEYGDEIACRAVFMVPKAATFKKLVVGCGLARKWAIDGSVVK